MEREVDHLRQCVQTIRTILRKRHNAPACQRIPDPCVAQTARCISTSDFCTVATCHFGDLIHDQNATEAFVSKESLSMKSIGTILATIFILITLRTANADVHDDIFSYGFDVPKDAPASQSEAARFLTQATFGPTAADIAKLTALGYSEWINEQLAVPPTLGEPTVESVVNALTADGQTVGQGQRLNRWFWQAAYAPDQLRQRMAYA